MQKFDVILSESDLLPLDVTNPALYQYKFDAYPITALQTAASNDVIMRIAKKLESHVSVASLIQKGVTPGDVKYTANLSKYAQEKLNSGEWEYGVRKKTGEMYAMLKDAKTGKIVSSVTLKKEVVKDIGNLPQLAALQRQLGEVSEQIQTLGKLVERVEQGQYNDRYAGFFSARQLIVEALATDDETIRKQLLLSAIAQGNRSIGELMLAINNNSQALVDETTKKKEIVHIEKLLQDSLGYLSEIVQLNMVAYTTLGEERALIASLANFRGFINQTLLTEVKDTSHSVAWYIDNGHSGEDAKLLEAMTNTTTKIDYLIEEQRNNLLLTNNNEGVLQ